ncbi:MAG: hypothetical protein HWE16_00035 [Gammaproteobacteria bacterium]|nr:hypothetical protein [Gammaproteobacteria bacterium]
MNIRELIEQFFLIFNNKNRQIGTFEQACELFIPEAQIIRYDNCATHNSDYQVMDLSSFLKPRLQMLSDGTLSKFREWQLESETQVDGALGYHRCRYQKSGLLHGKDYQGQGTKYFSLVKLDDNWKISSIIWQDSELG